MVQKIGHKNERGDISTHYLHSSMLFILLPVFYNQILLPVIYLGFGFTLTNALLKNFKTTELYSRFRQLKSLLDNNSKLTQDN